MNPRWLLAAPIVAGLGSGLAGHAFARPGAILGVHPGAAAGFNILLVTLDTTRADRIGCYGYGPASTPVLDRLAAGGVRFAEAVTVAPETLPAHATLLTGLFPPRHGVRINAESRLGSQHVSLAEVARARGYQTAAFVSAFVLDARFGLDQGFDHYDDRVDAATGTAFASGVNERRAGATTDAALAWLRSRDRSRPFLAWVHYFDAHAPYEAPQPFASRFAGAAAYDAEIAYVDAQLGRLLEGLDAAGLRDKTLAIVVGDHGESLGDHGERTHSVFLYRSTVRVPLVVWSPRLFPRPEVVDGTVVSLADLAPTVLDLLGVEDPPPRDGVSLLATKADPGRDVYVESLVPYLDFGWAPLFSLRSVRESYVLAPRPECYDLRSDPEERRNLIQPKGGKTGACAEQARLLERMLTRLPAHGAAAGGAPALGAETRERLQALGYLGGAGPVDHGPLADPKDMIDVAALVLDANALLSSGRPAEALEFARRAAARSPRDRTVLNTLAKIHLRLGRLKEAEDELRALRAIQPKSDASVLLAQILVLDGRLEEAGRLLDEAERLDSRHGGVHIARGDLLARQGRKDEARASYEKARQVDPYRAAGAAEARLLGLR